MRIPIFIKLIATMVVVLLLMTSVLLFSLTENQETLEDSIGENSIFLAEDRMASIDRGIFDRSRDLDHFMRLGNISDTLERSNSFFEDLPDRDGYMEEQESNWSAQDNGTLSPLQESIAENGLSQKMKKYFIEYYQDEHSAEYFLSMLITNKYGAVVGMTGSTSSFSQTEKAWWAEVQGSANMFLGEVEHKPFHDTYAIDVGTRILDGSGEFIGTIKGIINPIAVISGAEAGLKKYDTTQIKIVTQDGKLIYSSKSYHIYRDVTNESFFRKIKDESTFYSIEEHGVMKLYASVRSRGFRDFEGINWFLLVSHDRDELFVESDAQESMAYSTAGIVILAALVLGSILSWTISKPIQRLNETARALSNGELDRRITINSKDEIHELATTFNDMAEQIHTSMESMEITIRERTKEINCLYSVSRSTETTNRPLSTVLQEIVDALPAGWHNSESTCARIDFRNVTYTTQNYLETAWKLAAPIRVKNMIEGSVDVFLLPRENEMNTIEDIDPFLNEERALLQSIAERIERFVEIQDAETEMKAMEAHLRQSQKLESIGTLASGVAHEINNPIMGVINYADLIHGRVEDASIKEFSQGIMDEGNRVATIVRNLLSFSRQDSSEHYPVRISEIIEDSLSLTAAALRKDKITLETNIPDGLPQVNCRNQQIQQVILNLITNAQYALNKRYESYDENKKICISVKTFQQGGVHWQQITVEDHGTGIPPEVADHIFDPFFTTKGRTEGTGLGLSVSYGIIREHHGRITVESKPGEYTRFHVDLQTDADRSIPEMKEQPVAAVQVEGTELMVSESFDTTPIIEVATGEVEAAGANAILRSSAIASCVAIVAHDPVANVGALAHVMLPDTAPEKEIDRRNKYAADAIQDMTLKITDRGAVLERIDICLLGGGNVLQKSDDSICSANIASVTDLIGKLHLRIRATALGGTKRRSVSLTVATGCVRFTEGDGSEQVLWNPAEAEDYYPSKAEEKV